MGNYFDAITDAASFRQRRPSDIEDINKSEVIPAGSNWSTNELWAARVLVRAIRKTGTCDHLLPALQEHFEKAKTARDEPRIRELLAGPDQLDPDLTETEMVHRFGASLGPFWAALAKFGDYPSGDTHKRQHSSSGSDTSEALRLPLRSKRVKTATKHDNYVSSESMRVGSNSPTSDPAQSSQSASDFVPDGHSSSDIREQATVEIASSFIRHVLQACPPQDNTVHHQPPFLVEFSAVPSQLTMDTAAGATIRATADGELVVLELENKRYRTDALGYAALLEAKKRFKVEEGRPEMTDEVLGQMTCEALALRLWLHSQGDRDMSDVNVFVIAAVRRFMRFVQFHIPESYVAAMMTEGLALQDFVEVWATPWFDLKTTGGRRNAVDNIVGLVHRQSNVASRM